MLKIPENRPIGLLFVVLRVLKKLFGFRRHQPYKGRFKPNYTYFSPYALVFIFSSLIHYVII